LEGNAVEAYLGSPPLQQSSLERINDAPAILTLAMQDLNTEKQP
jgi:hypothetical protein